MQMLSIRYIFSAFICLLFSNCLPAQENLLSNYFSAGSFYNPALAGDTRFIQVQMVDRLQPTTASVLINNSLFSFNYKLQNHHSGIGVHINRRTSVFSETEFKTNYSHTFTIFKKVIFKAGLGISLNELNTHANAFKFPDQYDQYGFTGNPTQEPLLNEKALYTGFSAGMAVYYGQGWLTLCTDNINRPLVDFAGSESHIPSLIMTQIGYLIPLDKGKKAKRMFTRYGGIVPYSSVGPVAMFYKNGPFRVMSMGISAFTRPVYWGIQYRNNSVNTIDFSKSVASLNFLAGYRNEVLSVAYSYDFILDRTPTNYKGAHEITFAWYFYTIKEDYKKYPLFPYPNQLMY